MTIAAGFRVENGVVLCADTQYTGQGAKVHESKIFTIRISEDLFVSFVIAGMETTAKLFVQECREYLRDATADIHVDYIRQVAAEQFESVWDRYVDPANELTHFQVLVAVSGKRQGLRLWKIIAKIVLDVETFYCMGVGNYLGNYFFYKGYRPNMPPSEAMLLITQAFRAAKNYVDGCGGRTDIILIEPNGVAFASDQMDAEIAEEYIASYEAFCAMLLVKHLLF